MANISRDDFWAAMRRWRAIYKQLPIMNIQKQRHFLKDSKVIIQSPRMHWEETLPLEGELSLEFSIPEGADLWHQLDMSRATEACPLFPVELSSSQYQISKNRVGKWDTKPVLDQISSPTGEAPQEHTKKHFYLEVYPKLDKTIQKLVKQCPRRGVHTILWENTPEHFFYKGGNITFKWSKV